MEMEQLSGTEQKRHFLLLLYLYTGTQPHRYVCSGSDVISSTIVVYSTVINHYCFIADFFIGPGGNSAPGGYAYLCAKILHIGDSNPQSLRRQHAK